MGGATWVTCTDRSVTISEDAGQTASSTRSGCLLCYPSIYHWQVQSMSHFSISVIVSPTVCIYQQVGDHCPVLTVASRRGSVLRTQFFSASFPAWKFGRIPHPPQSLQHQTSLASHHRLHEEFGSHRSSKSTTKNTISDRLRLSHHRDACPSAALSIRQQVAKHHLVGQRARAP